VAACERAPAVQLAEAQESVVEVTAVRLPVEAPVIEATSRSGAEIKEIFFALPVPAVMFTVMNPTGSVVAVTFCALASGRAARTAAAARVSDVDFILMELDDFLFGFWKWIGAGGGFLAPVARVFWLSVFSVVVIC